MQKSKKQMSWQQRQGLKPQAIQNSCEATPEEVHFDESRLEVLNRHMQSMIDRGMIWSGSYCLARYGKVFADTALGKLARPWQERERFQPDTFFELQSITKIITAVAVLKLAEDGVLYLDEPAVDWLDEFDVGEFRKITILHLLTHTSGLVSLSGVQADVQENWFQKVDETDVSGTWVKAIVNAGLYQTPGTDWKYSMAGFLILGEIITRASGMRAEEFIRQTVLLPCGMKETHWKKEVTEEWLKRYNIASEQDIAACRQYAQSGKNAFIHYAPWAEGMEWEEIPETAGGLMSTSRELVQFGIMLLDGGRWQGKRVLGRQAVEYLFHNLIQGDIRDFCWNHPGIPVVYGAGAPIFSRAADCQQLVSEGVLYHEGHGSCMLMIDREEDFVAVYRTQFKNKDDWFVEGARGTASILWSGL